jgi:hypothetical protein
MLLCAAGSLERRVRFRPIADTSNGDTLQRMTPNEAYDAIRSALAAKPGTRVLDCTYDDAMFGNFVIGFQAQGRARSFVNDRGELALCSDLAGTQHCRTIVRSLANVDEQTLIEALAL